MKKDDELIQILYNSYNSIKTDRKRFTELDLGCGKGTFASILSEKYPERMIIAADMLIGRLRKVAKRNVRNGVDNMLVVKTEAWELFAFWLPDDSMDRIHLLCPDPWPKHKHKGYRLMCSEFIGRLYRKLKPEGVFHFSTDDLKYFNETSDIIRASGLFSRDDSQIADIVSIRSDFEKKWNETGLIVRHAGWVRNA